MIQPDLFAMQDAPSAAPGTEAKTRLIVPAQRVYSAERLSHLAEHLSGVTLIRDDDGNLREEYEYVVPGREEITV